jgi:hypothetical protein
MAKTHKLRELDSGTAAKGVGADQSKFSVGELSGWLNAFSVVAIEKLVAPSVGSRGGDP